jgi:hypothetical protein
VEGSFSRSSKKCLNGFLCQPTGTPWGEAGPLLSWVPGTPWQESASGLIRASGGFYIPDIGM